MKQLTFLLLFIPFLGQAQSPVERDLCKPKLSDQVKGEYYVLAHEMPSFKGGNEKKEKYLKKAFKKRGIKYPGSNQAYVRLLIEGNGEVKFIKHLKGIESDELKRIVEAVVEEMPAWNPGKCNETPQRVIYNLPLKL